MKALIVPAKGEPRIVEDCAGAAIWLLEGVMYKIDEDGSRDSGMPVYREAPWAPAPAPPRVRKPALPHAEQKTARPGIVYRVWNRSDADAVLIVASDGTSGRMLSIPGIVWVRLCAGTEAPSGEIALTDDDLETLLCDRWALTWRLQPSTSISEVGKVYHELKEMLFRSDPDVIAHVRKQMEVDNIISNIQIEPRMSLGLDKAWQRTFAGHQPEHAWMVRAAHRASEILRLRQEAAEKGSAEQ